MNPYQQRNDTIAHEAAHAVAAYLYGHTIDYVDCDRPFEGEGGRAELKPPTPEQMVSLRRWYHERAVIFRVGALVTNMDWYDDLCASDRMHVRKIADLLDIPVGAFEEIITYEAEQMLMDPRFDAPHRALCRELVEHIHEVMPGDRAHAIMEAAIAAA